MTLCLIGIVFFAGTPTPVTGLMTTDVCVNDFTISWDPVDSDQACEPLSYDVTLSSSDDVMMMKTTDTSYNFTGLTPNNNYTVIVAGSNKAGEGSSANKSISLPTMEQAVPSSKLHQESNQGVVLLHDW